MEREQGLKRCILQAVGCGNAFRLAIEIINSTGKKLWVTKLSGSWEVPPNPQYLGN